MTNDWTLEERSKRHKGAYKPELKDIPFELSRGKIETFIKCPRCFFMEKFQGIKPPGIPGFLLNTNTDTLLKKDHDQYRGKEPHPLMVKAGLEHLIPFEHEDLGKWEQSTQFGATPNHFNTWHRESNILFGGGLDDVWVELVRPREVLGRDDAPKGTGKLHIVDYKSTSQGSTDPNKIKPLDESLILEIAASHKKLISIEDNVASGGAGSAINELLQKNGITTPLSIIGMPDYFTEHGTQKELYELYGLSANNIVNCASGE